MVQLRISDAAAGGEMKTPKVSQKAALTALSRI
jgi:hypothetical protein